MKFKLSAACAASCGFFAGVHLAAPGGLIELVWLNGIFAALNLAAVFGAPRA